MSNNDSHGYGGRVRWGALSSALALGLAAAACGQASKADCADSVISSYTGECPGNDDGTAGTGATGATNTTDDGGDGGTNGGKGGSSGPNGGRGPTDEGPEIVYEWGTEGAEDGLDPGGWDIDNASGAWKGDNAVHPPKLKAHDEASMTFDCGGVAHTQVSFLVHRASENTELELFDGQVSRGLIHVGYGWEQQVIDVAPGKHDYQFVARNLGTTDIPAPYVLDGLVCKYATPTPGHNQVVSFDSGFVPVELDGWFVDNMRGTHQGEAAVHPPIVAPGDEPSMTFDCAAAEHTQLTFMVHRARENTELELFDGEVSRGLVEVGYGWAQQIINVDRGPHEYKFVVRNLGTTVIPEPYVLDTFACNDVEPAAGHNGLVTADDQAIPPELTGQWFVDNMRGVHQGEAAVHPPVIEGHAEKELLLDCGKLSSGLSFVAHRTTENAELEIFDGDDSRDMISVGYGWEARTYDMKTGKYRFVARNKTAAPIREPYVLDTFKCE